MIVIWRVTIPNWLPYRLNQLLHRHWAVRHRRRRQDDAMIAAYMRNAQVPLAIRPRTISLEITLAPKMRADADCFFKSVLDALVNCHALVDDSSKWTALGPVTITKGKEKSLTIVLEEEP